MLAETPRSWSTLQALGINTASGNATPRDGIDERTHGTRNGPHPVSASEGPSAIWPVDADRRVEQCWQPMTTIRLTRGASDRARALFVLMAEVFEEGRAELSDSYVDRLLAR